MLSDIQPNATPDAAQAIALFCDRYPDVIDKLVKLIQDTDPCPDNPNELEIGALMLIAFLRTLPLDVRDTLTVLLCGRCDRKGLTVCEVELHRPAAAVRLN